MERQDLFDALGSAMRGTTREAFLDGRVRAGRVKSRLLEAHPREQSRDGVSQLLARVADAAHLKLTSAGDDLWLLLGSDDVFFVDTLNRRFWLLHTTASVHNLQRLLRRHVLPEARLDQAWLSRQQLQELEGERCWVRSSFRSDTLEPRQSGRQVPRRWRIQVEGEDPDELLELVSQQARYRAGAALTAVGSILRGDGDSYAKVAADYQGGFVASGTDFHVVVGMLWRTLDRYERYVQQLEQMFRLGTAAADDLGLTVEGEVATIALPRRVEDLDSFVANLFTCKEPFRLWAVPREVAPGQWEANAVDLHVGDVIRLEITSEWIRVLLGSTTCGNTLARLVANLQHRFDARSVISNVAA